MKFEQIALLVNRDRNYPFSITDSLQRYYPVLFKTDAKYLAATSNTIYHYNPRHELNGYNRLSIESLQIVDPILIKITVLCAYYPDSCNDNRH